MEIEGIENWIEFSKPADLNGATTKKFQSLFILYFYTEWNEASVNLKKSLSCMAEFLLEPIYVCINADNFKEVAEPYEINSVPTIVFVDGSKVMLKKWENPTGSKLYDQIKEMLKLHSIHFEKMKSEMENKVSKILNQHEMVVFIKGSPKAPKCKFTRQLLEEFAPYDLNYYYFDILQDEDVRSWNRYISGKNTYPQIYFNQKLIGGLDDIRALKSSGKFEDMIPPMAKKDIPIRRVTRILTSSDVLAILDGDISKGISGQSKELLDFLKSQPIKFSIYNGNSDPSLLKEMISLSEKTELPLLFIHGQCLGTLESLRNNPNFIKLVPISSWKLEGKDKFEEMQKQFSKTVFVDDLSKEQKGISLIKKLRDSNEDFAYIDISKDSAMKSYLLSEKMNYSSIQVWSKGVIQEIN